MLDVARPGGDLPGHGGPIRPVRGVGFSVGRGEAVGVVGESGSGKSLTALAVARLVEEPGRVDARPAASSSAPTCAAGTARAHRRLLGTSLAMVFQDPMTSFNPTRRIGRQLAEVGPAAPRAVPAGGAGPWRSTGCARCASRPPQRRARQYPHEFSGGMRQRAMIGMGLMGTPALIVADEPTTALDVTVQRQVLDLLRSIRATDGVALLLISHDVAVVAQVCDRVLVMYAGPDRRGPAGRRAADRRAASLHAGAGRRRAGHGHRPRPAARRDPRAARSTRPTCPAGCAFAAALPARRRTGAATEDPPLETDGGRAGGSPAGTPASRCADRPRSTDGGHERAAVRRRHRPLRHAATA